MTKSNRTKLSKNVTWLAGAAVTALATHAHADVAGDALINKLEQKGVLSSDEAKQLRLENQDDFNSSFTNSFGKSFSKMTGMPDWVTGYKFSGDFRGRYDYRGSENSAMVDRNQFRYRLRVGLAVNIKDDFQVGFRVGSGDSGKPLSNNQTLSGNASKKPLYVDTAYGKWTPINDGTWMLAATVGKMDNPFQFTPMVFDPDLTPEGAAIQGKYTINDRNDITYAGAVLVLDEVAGSTHDPYMYGGQVAWNSKLTEDLASSVGVGALQIGDKSGLTAIGGNNKNNYNPIIADASLTYTLDSFPLYPGKFPIKVAAEYMNNPGVSQNNNGYWAGITFGKSGKKHTWDLSYRYEYVEANAWYNQLMDDDNAAFVPTSLTAGSFSGGTNIKGHLIKFNYSIYDSLTFSLTCYVNDLINNPVAGAKTGAVHAMADIMWKF